LLAAGGATRCVMSNGGAALLLVGPTGGCTYHVVTKGSSPCCKSALMWVQHFRVLSYNHRIGSGPPGSRLPYFYELHHLIATSLHPGGPNIQSWFADKTPFK